MKVQVGRGPIQIPILPVVGAVLLLVLAFWSMRVGAVGGSQIGVFVNNLNGAMEIVTRPGSQFYCGVYTDFYVLDNTVQSLRMVDSRERMDALDIKTKDGSDVHLDVALNYRLLQDSEIIRRAVIPECGLDVRRIYDGAVREVDAYRLKWVRDFARAVIRYKFGELKTDEFYSSSSRDKKATEAESEINQLLKAHGIEVMNLVPERFRFYAEYEKKIAEKKAADQEVQSQEQIALATLESQKKRMAEATAIVNVDLARLDGELKQEVLKVEAAASKEKLGAEAYAFTTRTNAEAELLRAESAAQATIAKAKAEADGLKAMAASLSGEGGRNLVKLEYARALQKATITGVPYATDPRIQKVELEQKPAKEEPK